MSNSLTTPRLVALFCCGWLLFNFPLLGLWDGAGMVWGMPVLWVAVLLLWALLIGALAWLMERHAPDEQLE